MHVQYSYIYRYGETVEVPTSDRMAYAPIMNCVAGKTDCYECDKACSDAFKNLSDCTSKYIEVPVQVEKSARWIS